MKYTLTLKKLLLAASFIVYLYLLIRLILFKMGSVNIPYLIQQLQRTLQDPDRIFNRQGNYIPFKEINRGIQDLSISNPFAIKNVAGNIIAFIPFGILVPMLFKPKASSFITVFFYSFLLSLSFELTQLFLYIGTFDVDDLILNTSGGMIGYGVFRLLTIFRGNK